MKVLLDYLFVNVYLVYIWLYLWANDGQISLAEACLLLVVFFLGMFRASGKSRKLRFRQRRLDE
ncbi:hypothetical protein J31TS4_27170 [Paenibacillus sp. J31TS4]|uniref:hypothetical protein n=1 Tax=Paenibacillus sp. J31TS4 TaxID=2807195 RepID=UPI001B130C08|nr:hypothetical protein [Paenibacillus sp. J31TS4]GIP39437.1 hypothetical protein J31TS4_27170 [Paenibacillus sp. J31TS4]